jgi:hypothetical protein
MKIFEILRGLPGSSLYPIQFSLNEKKTYSEGFVVEFYPSNNETWVGNFQLGLSHYSNVVNYPGREGLIVVIAGGDVYVIDVNKKQAVDAFNAAITSIFLVLEKNLIIFIEHSGLIAFGTKGVVWRYEINNCDGIRALSYSNNLLSGESCQVPEDIWNKFQIDINIGRVIIGNMRTVSE